MHRKAGFGRPLLLLVVAAMWVGGCASSGRSSTSDRSPNVTTGPGRVQVMAAASLTNVVTDGRAALEQEDAGWDIPDAVTGGSQDLVRQVQDGFDADVIALADTAAMKVLEDDDLVEEPVVFATNKLIIAVAPGNPKGIRSLADLARDDVSVVLADPSVPAGKYAKQALDAADVTVEPKSLELDVRSALAKVSKEADAAIVYVTDVDAMDDEVDGVTIPDDQNVVASYPVAVVRGTKHRGAAGAYVDSLVSGTLHDLLVEAGFGEPT